MTRFVIAAIETDHLTRTPPPASGRKADLGGVGARRRRPQAAADAGDRPRPPRLRFRCG